MDLTEQINQAMAQQKVSRIELARRLGVTKAAVTNMLKPDNNFTVGSLQRIADALGISLSVTLDTDEKEPSDG